MIDARRAYDLVAPAFDTWLWSGFWRSNEAPVIRDWLTRQPPGLGLDAGAGTSPYSNLMAKAGHRALHVDASWGMLHRARVGARVVGLLDHIPVLRASFDWVLSTRVLSHVEDITPVLDELSWLLKPGGELLITDVHPCHPYTCVSIPDVTGHSVDIFTFKHSLQSILIAARRARFTDAHIQEFTASDLQKRPTSKPFRKLYGPGETAVFYVLSARRE